MQLHQQINKLLKFFCYVVSALISTFAFANSADSQNINAQELAKKNACLSCHAVDKKIIGPPFTEIAKKYRNNPSASTYLISRVRNGGSGVWGVVAMPANRNVDQGELEKIIQWVLTQP
jgi:cytochrome c